MSLKLDVNFAATLKDGPAIQPNKAPIKDIVEVRSKKLLIYKSDSEYIWKPLFAPGEKPKLSFIAISVPRFTYEKCGHDGKVEKVSGVAFAKHLLEDKARAELKADKMSEEFVDELYDNLLLVHRTSQSLDHLTPNDKHSLFIRVSRCMFDVAKPADALVVTVVYGVRS